MHSLMPCSDDKCNIEAKNNNEMKRNTRRANEMKMTYNKNVCE